MYRSIIPGARHFALWLVPGKHHYNLFAGIIRDLAKQYSAPYFEPHVTVYSGVCAQEDNLEKLFTESAQTLQPTSLIVKGIGAYNKFFKALVVEFQDSPTLEALSQRTKSSLNYQRQYDLSPHLSLVYMCNCVSDNRVSDKQKQAIETQLGLVEHFDGLAIVSPSSKGWKDVGGWEVRFRQELESG